MPLEHWLSFVAATLVLMAIPGPTVLLVVSYALGHGRKSAAAIVAGVALGDLTSMTLSMIGLGALLVASAALFTILRWVGGAYLIYLGIRLWRTPVAPDAMAAAPDARPWRMFAHAYAVTALNPKSIVFFVGFVPLFIVPSHPFWVQASLLEATFVSLAIVSSTTYALLAAAARQRLRRPGVRRAMNRAGGSVLVGAGVAAIGLHTGG